MKTIWTLTMKELRSFFDSLIAYIILALFLGLSGIFTWLPVADSDIFFHKQATLRGFFSISYWTLFFFIPAITMRMIAEEKKTGTIELLLTKSISDRQLVLGKFLASFILIALALFFTFPYVITLAKLGNLDNGGTICGYLGLLLMSGVYISIGLYASSITSNQIVAFLLSLITGLFFHMIFGFLGHNIPGAGGELFSYLSLTNHFESISRGVIDTKDLVYFFSLIFLGLFLTEGSISKRKTAG